MAMARPLAGPAAPGGVDLSAAIGRSGWPVVFAIWAAYAVCQIVLGFPGAISAMLTDDAMRLAEVRDLMAGHEWFDLTQARLNPPDGVAMHWSRLIDLPIALILSGSEALFEPDLALKIALTLWPLLVLLPGMLASASASAAVAGPSAGALSAVMLALSPAVTTHFQPGRLDHHNVQIALALTMLACAMRIDRSAAAAVGAGLAGAAMMAIGMETAPHVAACAAILALRWAIEGEAVARGARLFGIAFAGGSIAAAVALVAPGVWSAPVCDALGAGQIFAAVIGGVGLAVAVALTKGGLLARLAALAQVGVATVAGVALVAPACLTAPYAALPERLRTEWMAKLPEAKSFAAMSFADPTSAMVFGLALAGAVAVALWALLSSTGATRWRVATVVAMFAVACLVTAWQIRGASLAFAIGGVLLPVAALAIGRAGGPLRTALAVAGLSPMALGAAGLGVASALGLSQAESRGPTYGLCPVEDFRAFAKLPAGLALNTTDTGPFILAHTRHSAIAAPYHRNVEGLLAALDAFEGSEETARAVAVSRRIDFVVGCVGDGGLVKSAAAHPDGFSAKLLSGATPDWLTPVDLGPGARLKVWRVIARR